MGLWETLLRKTGRLQTRVPAYNAFWQSHQRFLDEHGFRFVGRLHCDPEGAVPSLDLFANDQVMMTSAWVPDGLELYVAAPDAPRKADAILGCRQGWHPIFVAWADFWGRLEAARMRLLPPQTLTEAEEIALEDQSLREFMHLLRNKRVSVVAPQAPHALEDGVLQDLADVAALVDLRWALGKAVDSLREVGPQLELLQAIAAGRSRDVKALREVRLRDHAFELRNTDPELADALMYAGHIAHCLRRGLRATRRDHRLDWFTQFQARRARGARQ